ncbi:hypothetical protein FA95DRAFT_82582 [Auriscalpium vulgare]|uniref:Uncharacterized protein n=1 Tax=Auriscalpium vulgare TaxID=40419 RepID=A0ACB8RQC2_9AGAM|nr:hypothetical protein FA95DRAFT_82582 [Auriscalpium vulgare]
MGGILPVFLSEPPFTSTKHLSARLFAVSHRTLFSAGFLHDWPSALLFFACLSQCWSYPICLVAAADSSASLNLRLFYNQIRFGGFVRISMFHHKFCQV